MSAVKVTFQDLYDASSMLNRGSDTIDNQLAQMRQQLSPIQSSWEGAARQNFDQLYQEWDDAARRLRETLSEISRVVQTTGQNYEETEQRNAQAFGR